jgi:hypothetical protein
MTNSNNLNFGITLKCIVSFVLRPPYPPKRTPLSVRLGEKNISTFAGNRIPISCSYVLRPTYYTGCIIHAPWETMCMQCKWPVVDCVVSHLFPFSPSFVTAASLCLRESSTITGVCLRLRTHVNKHGVKLSEN